MADKLLIVDDESDVRDFVAHFFRKRKVDVFTAAGGEEALQAIVTERPEIVLLDIRMEGMDGIEVLRRIKELNKQVKVVMVTGRDDDEAKQTTKRLGACGYINKPLELDELEKAVLRILDRPKWIQPFSM